MQLSARGSSSDNSCSFCIRNSRRLCTTLALVPGATSKHLCSWAVKTSPCSSALVNVQAMAEACSACSLFLIYYVHILYYYILYTQAMSGSVKNRQPWACLCRTPPSTSAWHSGGNASARFKDASHALALSHAGLRSEVKLIKAAESAHLDLCEETRLHSKGVPQLTE